MEKAGQGFERRLFAYREEGAMNKPFAVFIVSWKVVWYTMGICDSNKPKLNPYTGEMQWPQNQIAMACYGKNEKTMTKEFASRKEIEDFKSNCGEPGEDGGFAMFSQIPVCSEWKIEELKKVE